MKPRTRALRLCTRTSAFYKFRGTRKALGRQVSSRPHSRGGPPGGRGAPGRRAPWSVCPSWSLPPTSPSCAGRRSRSRRWGARHRESQVGGACGRHTSPRAQRRRGSHGKAWFVVFLYQVVVSPPLLISGVSHPRGDPCADGRGSPFPSPKSPGLWPCGSWRYYERDRTLRGLVWPAALTQRSVFQCGRPSPHTLHVRGPRTLRGAHVWPL